MAVIHHLVAAEDWHRDLDRPYSPASLADEGFVHCSPDLDTLLTVANRFYRHLTGDVLVVDLDEECLTADLRWEAPAHPDGSATNPADPRFPHVYGPLDRNAVIAVRRLRRGPGGTYIGIDGLLSRASGASGPRTPRR